MNEQNKLNAFKFPTFLSSFALHIIAMLIMLGDHLWATFLSDFNFLTYIGRLAFPIFAFMIAEGFHHTKNVKKYILRILFFALLTEIPFNMTASARFFNYTHQNVLWTFLLSILALCIFKLLEEKSTLQKLIFIPLTIIVFYFLGIVLFVDYYGAGVLTVILFYFTRIQKENTFSQTVLKMLLQVIGLYIINFEILGGLVIPLNIFGFEIEFPVQGLAIFSLIFIWCYNGKQGPYNKAIKYFYYLFYPLHLLILGSILMFG